MNLPRTHYAPPTAVSTADVILGLELSDFWGTVNAYTDNGEHGIGVIDAHQARHQADQRELGGAQHKGELPGLPALPGDRRADGGRSY
jgi:hypothetical protein